MMCCDIQRRRRFVFMLISFIGFFLFPLSETLSAEPTLSIEKLTQGKVKVGDLITKDNVDLVKDFLLPGNYYLVKEGMCFEIAPSPAPYETVPKFYAELTEKVHKQYGEPVIDQNAVIYTKDGKYWPGGTPYPHPSNVLEILANMKYEKAWDDYENVAGIFNPILYHDGEKIYKSTRSEAIYVCSKARLTYPPLGEVPGSGDEFYRIMIVLQFPLDIKGIGQLSIRYWDDVKHEDEGFAYLASFKRIVRISATTWQDNMAGSDMKWGDAGGGYLEPCNYYNWKWVETKPMLVPSFYNSFPRWDDKAKAYDLGVTYDGPGKKFPREKWFLLNVYVVESIPKIPRHCYGKRIQLVATPEYSPSQPDIVSNVDFYDPQMRLWKVNVESRGIINYRGETGCTWKNQAWYDIQTGHTSHAITPTGPGFDRSVSSDPRTLTLKTLIKWGK